MLSLEVFDTCKMNGVINYFIFIRVLGATATKFISYYPKYIYDILRF